MVIPTRRAGRAARSDLSAAPRTRPLCRPTPRLHKSPSDSYRTSLLGLTGFSSGPLSAISRWWWSTIRHLTVAVRLQRSRPITASSGAISGTEPQVAFDPGAGGLWARAHRLSMPCPEDAVAARREIRCLRYAVRLQQQRLVGGTVALWLLPPGFESIWIASLCESGPETGPLGRGVPLAHGHRNRRRDRRRYLEQVLQFACMASALAMTSSAFNKWLEWPLFQPMHPRQQAAISCRSFVAEAVRILLRSQGFLRGQKSRGLAIAERSGMSTPSEPADIRRFHTSRPGPNRRDPRRQPPFKIRMPVASDGLRVSPRTHNPGHFQPLATGSFPAPAPAVPEPEATRRPPPEAGHTQVGGHGQATERAIATC